MAGAGLGAMILPIFAQTIITRSGWRAAYLSLGSTRAAAQLALYPGTWHSPTRICSCRTFWTDLAARPALLCLLDYCRRPVREFDQHERSRHAPICCADRSRHHRRRRCVMRVLAWWFEPAGQDWSRLAAEPIFRGARRLYREPNDRGGIFLLSRANSFAAGRLAAGLIGAGAGGEAPLRPTC
jgi:hypothetical protein